MNAETIRALQAPLKERYRQDPESARVTLYASGQLDRDVACRVETAAGPVVAGLHPASGGSGDLACSGEMLLEALVACAGVTLRAVATTMDIRIDHGVLRAEGDLDFRGTLGIGRDAPVGFSAIRLSAELETPASEQQIAKLLQLTERYCVVYQTLSAGIRVELSHTMKPRRS